MLTKSCILAMFVHQVHFMTCNVCVSFLSRLVMYIERDLRKATPLRENPSQSVYLSQCLDLLIVYLSTTAPVILGMHIQFLSA